METELSSKRAKLVLQGPTGTIIHPLDKGTITAGRGTTNTLVVNDPRVSRVHARLEFTPQGYRILDAGSQNGTWVNGNRVQTAILRDGDVVQLGATRLTYREDEDASSVIVSPAKLDPESTNEFTLTEVGRRAPEDAPPADLAERFHRVAELMRAISGAVGSDRFFDQLINAAVDLTSAERGFIIVNTRQGMEFRAARNIGQEDRRGPEFEVSWSIAVKVGTTGDGVLLVDALHDERFRAIESVESLGLRSVLCVPIRSELGIQGVIYLDNRLQLGAFTADDRAVIDVLADQAGVVLGQERLSRDLKARQQEVESLNRRLKEKLSEQDTELTRMRAELRAGRVEADAGFQPLIGGSARMDELRSLMRKIAPSELPVLVFGESGTGKELVARCIHQSGPRANSEMVSVNCAAFPEGLLEAELFGHVRGAFTGADRAKKGLLEAAHGGTLFLDEVECMSPGMQSRLLRVLQEGEIRPVGAQQSLKVDVRVIAASNQDLRKMVADGTFREDLYYRLRVLQVNIPPLRDRREDIAILVAHFIEKYAPSVTVSAEALDLLMSYSWPGNVRELENEIRRCAVIAGPVIGVEGLSKHISDSTRMLIGEESSFHDLGDLVKMVESREIQKALKKSAGNKTRAADLLGISRFTLQRKLDKYGIAAEDD